MNDLQLSEIIGLIRVNYKNFFKNENKQDKKLMLKTWKYHFANVSEDLMFKLLMDYMATESSYPPSIAAINKLLYGMINEDVGSAEDSFNKIHKMVSSYGSDERGYNKALEYFNDMEMAVIDKTYWRTLGMSEDPYGVKLAEYQKKYNSKKETITMDKRKQLSNIDSKDILESVNKRKLLK